MTQIDAPPPFRVLDPRRAGARKQVLIREIRIERARPTYRRRRRRVLAVLVPAAILSVAATGYALLKPDQVVAAGIGCFDQPSLDANVAIVSTSGESPEAVCAKEWQQGAVRLGTNEVPPLVACVNEPGAVLVFPSSRETICTELGLQDLPAGYEEAAGRFVKMRDAIIRELFRSATRGSATERNACLRQDEALRIVRRILHEQGFKAWTAEIAAGDYAGRTCANLVAFDDRAKKVLVIPTDEGIDPNPFGPH